MESFQIHGSNIVRLQLALGNRRWYIVGCYVAPEDALTIEGVVAAIGKRPWGGTLLVVGDFNTAVAAPEGQERYEVITVARAEEGLEDMSGHVLPRHQPWLKDGRTCEMHQGGQEVCSQTDYILGTDSRLFQNVSVRDAQHNTDQYLVLGCLCRAEPAAHSRYLGKRTHFLIMTPAPPGKVDLMFTELQVAIPKPPPAGEPPSGLYIT